MSMDELYESYAAGKLARGAFIRRLVGFGISLPVAAAYAAAINPGTAHAAGKPGTVPPANLYVDLYHGPF
jgi:hypothetical protein